MNLRRTWALTWPVILGMTLVATTLVKSGCAQDNQATEDFKIQGEYTGQSKDGAKLGAQVIARGDGKFEAFFLAGGLPGAGWDGKTRIQTSGAISPLVSLANITVLSGNGWEATIRNQILTGKTAAGKAFTLRRVVRQSPTLGAKAPAGAIVLFDGSHANEWENGRLVEGNLLRYGTTSKRKFGDFTLHLEFRLPFMPKAGGQGRGNSGVYLQNRYECQVLDSFGLTGEDNECGGFYRQAKPLVNMCFPPLTWQTYDIEFKAARFDANGNKTANARATVIHNGVKIHDNKEFTAATAGNGLPENALPGPFHLQDHGDAVVYRNIWVITSENK